ncbi:hypothetical protein KA977_11040 [Candidatus Dependentiae bacterium]|nr:hypothetical protein [Candidatus Dependentiae bacterium]
MKKLLILTVCIAMSLCLLLNAVNAADRSDVRSRRDRSLRSADNRSDSSADHNSKNLRNTANDRSSRSSRSSKSIDRGRDSSVDRNSSSSRDSSNNRNVRSRRGVKSVGSGAESAIAMQRASIPATKIENGNIKDCGSSFFSPNTKYMLTFAKNGDIVLMPNEYKAAEIWKYAWNGPTSPTDKIPNAIEWDAVNGRFKYKLFADATKNNYSDYLANMPIPPDFKKKSLIAYSAPITFYPNSYLEVTDDGYLLGRNESGKIIWNHNTGSIPEQLDIFSAKDLSGLFNRMYIESKNGEYCASFKFVAPHTDGLKIIKKSPDVCYWNCPVKWIAGGVQELKLPGEVIWKTGQAQGYDKCDLDSKTGNFKIIGSDIGDNKTNTKNLPTFQTYTTGNPDAYFQLTDDGNLLLYNKDGSKVLWSAFEIDNPNAGKENILLKNKEVTSGFELKSPNGKYKAKFSGAQWKLFDATMDEKDNASILWESPKTYNSQDCISMIKEDGGFVVYSNYQNKFIFNSLTGISKKTVNNSEVTDTYGNPGAYLEITNDGFLALKSKDGSKILWKKGGKILSVKEAFALNLPSKLNPGESFDKFGGLKSPNGKFLLRFAFGTDKGELSVFDENGEIIYSFGNYPFKDYTEYLNCERIFKMQEDGKAAVLYSQDNLKVMSGSEWSKKECAGAPLELLDSGILIIRNPKRSDDFGLKRGIVEINLYMTVKKGLENASDIYGGEISKNEVIFPGKRFYSPNKTFYLENQGNRIVICDNKGKEVNILFDGNDKTIQRYLNFMQNGKETNLMTGYVSFNGQVKTDKVPAELPDKPIYKVLLTDEGDLVLKSADNDRIFWSTKKNFEFTAPVALQFVMLPGQSIVSQNKTAKLTFSENGKTVDLYMNNVKTSTLIAMSDSKIQYGLGVMVKYDKGWCSIYNEKNSACGDSARISNYTKADYIALTDDGRLILLDASNKELGEFKKK